MLLVVEEVNYSGFSLSFNNLKGSVQWQAQGSRNVLKKQTKPKRKKNNSAIKSNGYSMRSCMVSR